MVKATRNRYAKPFLTLPNIGNIVCDFAYDNASRPISESLTTRGQSYTCTTGWDTANRKTQITYPDGSIVNRAYTDRNQLSQIQYQTSVIDTRTYDDGMRLQTCTTGNGIITNYGYRADNLTSSITRTGLSGADFTYDYDENKNKTQETISGVMANYGFNSLTPAQYDDEDRLIGWNRDDGNQDQTWNLSLVGDWDSFTEQAVTETRTHSGVHELESITGGSITGGLSYDAKGNLVNHSNGHDYTWDFDNKLTLATVSSGEPGIAGTHNYTYDALGRRVSKTVGSTTTVFVCSGQQVLAEYSGGIAATNPTRQYVYGTYIDEPILMDAGGTQYYYHCNHLYSIAALTDSLGNVVERYAYDAYGTPTILDASATTILLSSMVDNPYLFTGRRLDEETKVYHYRARYYDSELGRFIGRDPIGYAARVLNLYEYVRCKPLQLLDPSGNKPQKHSVKTEGGRFEWTIKASDFQQIWGPEAEIELYFFPNCKCPCKNISFIQVVTETVWRGKIGIVGFYEFRSLATHANPETGQYIDALQGETDVYYGAKWDAKETRWISEDKQHGQLGQCLPSGSAIPAHLSDAPGQIGGLVDTEIESVTEFYVARGDFRARFESCAVCIDSGKIYGCLEWGYENIDVDPPGRITFEKSKRKNTLVGGTPNHFRDTPSSAWLEALIYAISDGMRQ